MLRDFLITWLIAREQNMYQSIHAGTGPRTPAANVLAPKNGITIELVSVASRNNSQKKIGTVRRRM
jgi:hypothetical protein